MAVGERDPHTGHMTTGHEWNDIKELNTPVPRTVYVFLAGAFLFSLVYWLLMPAWPLGFTYTKGLLGLDQKTTVDASLKEAMTERASWSGTIEAAAYQDIQADPSLMQIVRGTGWTLFGDNCAVCHGVDAKGGPGFPDLTDAAWLWGGDPEAIFETVRVGINSAHPETRVTQMPAFGRGPDAGSQRHREGRDLRSVARRPGRGDCGERGGHRGGQADIRRQLRRLPWRGRQGEHRARRSGSERIATGSMAATGRRSGPRSTMDGRGTCPTGSSASRRSTERSWLSMSSISAR